MMNQNQFEKLINDLNDNVKKVPISKAVHWENENSLSNGYKFWGQEVRSQYIGRINQPLKIGLGRIIQKLENLDPIQDEDYYGTTIYPAQISDDLIRVGELLRRDGTLFGYVDSTNNSLYGVVSDQHTFIPDKVVYDTVTKFVDMLGEKYTMNFDHNIYKMRIDINFPELGIEIGRNDNLSYRIIVINSFCGHRSLGYDAGFLRFACTNGVIICDDHISFRQVHKGANDKKMLGMLVGSMAESFSGYDKYAKLLREAVEVAESYIDEKTSLVNWLPDNFDIKIAEAREAIKIMKTNDYGDNAFWVGQSIAEVARDLLLEDRLRLEEIAGQIMLAQVT